MGDRDPKTPIRGDALTEMRDSIFQLSLGNSYLCEDPFLIKIGHAIDSNIETLKEDILSLKARFPGKFTHEIDTDAILEEIRITAQSLQKPNKETNDKCIVGDLGRELEISVKSLTNAINTLKAHVEGGDLTYTKKDTVLGLFDGFGKIGDSVGTALALGLKVLICLIVLSLIPFFYLFMTLEAEEDLLKDMAIHQDQAGSQREIYAKLDQDKEAISKKIESIENKGGEELSRQDKIKIMELDRDTQKIDLKRQEVELKIAIHDEEIAKNKKKIETIKNTSFFKRLLQL